MGFFNKYYCSDVNAKTIYDEIFNDGAGTVLNRFNTILPITYVFFIVKKKKLSNYFCFEKQGIAKDLKKGKFFLINKAYPGQKAKGTKILINYEALTFVDKQKMIKLSTFYMKNLADTRLGKNLAHFSCSFISISIPF